MAALDNHRHERFAQELAKGATADEAYAAAGYKPNRHNASRLKTNEHIKARVSEILERGAVRAEITLAQCTADLLRMKDALLNVGVQADEQSGREVGLSHQHINTARQCIMDAAKLNGLIVDKVQSENVNYAVSAEPIDDPEEWLSQSRPN